MEVRLSYRGQSYSGRSELVIEVRLDVLKEVKLANKGRICSKMSLLFREFRLGHWSQACLNLLTAIKLACRNLTCLWILDFLKEVKLFYNPNSHPNGFYWRHQHSCTLTPANSMQVPNMLSDDCNRRYPGLRQGLNLLCPRSQRGQTCLYKSDMLKEVRHVHRNQTSSFTHY